ncbi:MAG: hypothetical protein ACE5OS_06360 [Anaerolineae bacterium]
MNKHARIVMGALAVMLVASSVLAVMAFVAPNPVRAAPLNRWDGIAMEGSAGNGGALLAILGTRHILCVPNGVSQCLVEFGDV